VNPNEEAEESEDEIELPILSEVSFTGRIKEEALILLVPSGH